jgi:nicotinamide mononucleotide transporter PnuC
VICFFWGILTVIAFGAISFNNKAFGNTISYWGFYIPAQIIAWILWYRASDDKVEIKPTVIKWWGIVIAAITSVGVIALFTWIETLNGFQSFWYGDKTNTKYTLFRCVLDSSIFILPITLSVFAWLRFRERWVLSIFIDSIQTIFWILLATGYDQKPKGPEVNANWIMMISSLTMLITAIYGTYNWYKHSTKNATHK